MNQRLLTSIMLVGGMITFSLPQKATAHSATESAIEKTETFTTGEAFRNLYNKASHKRKNGKKIANDTLSKRQSQTLRKSKYVGDGPFSLGASLVYSDDIDRGIYTINELGEFAGLAVGEDYNATYGGIRCNDKYFVANSARVDGVLKNYNILYNTTTWREINRTETADVNTFSYAMAEDPTTGIIYGCFLTSDGEGTEFGTIDIEAFQRTSTIAPLDKAWQAASCGEDGTLYVLLDDGSLNTVDKSNGKLTKVGQTGIPMEYLSSGVINHRDGKFYFASNTDDEWKLYAIDTRTAQSMAIIDFGEDIQLRGMFIGDPLASDKAPFSATVPKLDFEPGALSGYVTFKTPDKLYDGSAPSGALNYRVERTRTEVASGTTDWGKNERIPFSVDRPGPYRITVIMSNDAGDSPESTLRAWIGNDFPASPAKVNLERDGNKNIISWTPVTESLNNGYVNPDEITYNVSRYPDNKIVASNLTSTTFTDIVEEPSETTVYRYSVTAVFDGREGLPTVSDDLTLGALRLPFFEDFSTVAGAEKFKIIDANNDGLTWEFSSQKRNMSVRYSKTERMDDWLITPPLMLEAGRSYGISFDASETTPKYGPERVEAFIGTSPTAAGMKTEIVPPTIINEKETLTATVTVDKTGAYYLGIHGCSDPDKFYLGITNIRIEDGVFDDSPAAGTLIIKPDYNGESKATIAATAPLLDVSGNNLSSLAKLTVTRNGEQIYEKVNPTPGETYEFIDNVPAPDYYTYAMSAWSASGAGKLVEVTSHVGMNLPGAPTNVKVSEIGNSGKVNITWEAPTADTDGNPMNPELLSYSIFDFDNDEIAAYLTSLSHTYQAVAPEKQAFTRFYVHAESEAGLNEWKFGVSPLTAVGNPYTLPFTETFINGALTHLWAQGGDGEWMMIGSSNTPQADPQDGDGGMIAYIPRMAGTSGRFFSGKIALGDTENPAFSFFYFADPANNNTIEVTARDLNSGEAASTMATFKLNDGNGWSKVVVNLQQYKGKNVEVGIICNCIDNTDQILFDNFRIMNMLPDNLSVASVELPRSTYAGTPLPAKITIENNGSALADGFTVRLYANREIVDETEAIELAPGKRMVVELTLPTTPFTDPNLTCYAEVAYAADMDLSDNSSPRVDVSVEPSPYPAVNNLDGTCGSTPMLTWSAPDITDISTGETTEDFESFESFDINPSGKWSFADVDGSATYSVQGVSFPNNGARMAYIVFDAANPGFSNAYAAHSGNKYLACMAATSGVNDDWVISPELNGEEQTISFYAKSYSNQYNLESFRILTSATDRSLTSFTCAATEWNVPVQWTKYDFKLAEGTRYFAIECISEDSFIFMLDDITYTPSSPNAGLELAGYNVYRDSKLSGSSAEESFADTDATADSHTYHVTAVYNKGESALSNPVVLSTSGIEKTTLADNIEIYTTPGEIHISAPATAGISVHGIDGVMVFSGYGESHIQVESGFYAVTVDNRTVKTAVR